MKLQRQILLAHLLAAIPPLAACAWPAGPSWERAAVAGALALASVGGAAFWSRARLRRAGQSLATLAHQTGEAGGGLNRLARRVNATAGEMARSMEDMARGADLQHELVEKTSTLIGELARSIARASHQAEDAARSAAETSAVAQSGSQMAGKAVDKMRAVFETLERTAARVAEFGDHTKEIGNIVRVITEVAQQTHLLAINATIEAARAGDAGRGFAVVAEEIRQLAENTSRSAERIGGIVEQVSALSVDAVQAARASGLQLSEGRDQLTSILDALRNIVATVTAGADRVQIISRLAREQIAGAEQGVLAVENIATVARRNAAAAEAVTRSGESEAEDLLEITRLADELVRLAGELHAELARFPRGAPR